MTCFHKKLEKPRVDDALLFSIERVADVLSICRSNVFKLIGSGKLRTVKIGRRTLVPRKAIDEFLAEIGAA